MSTESPRPLTTDELRQLILLGERVHGVLTDAGLPAGFQPDPAGPPPVETGARILIDQHNPGGVYVDWAIDPQLRRRVAALQPRDLTHPDLKLALIAGSAMSAAIERILGEAGFATSAGYDMNPAAVWVRRA